MGRGPDRIRAVELSVPNVIATFQVIHRDSHLNVVDSRVYNIDLNSGKKIVSLFCLIWNYFVLFVEAS